MTLSRDDVISWQSGNAKEIIMTAGTMKFPEWPKLGKTY
jgi:hypothetical protein